MGLFVFIASLPLSLCLCLSLFLALTPVITKHSASEEQAALRANVYKTRCDGVSQISANIR